MAEQWLSIVEYARTYKVSDMTVRRRIKTGKLEAILQDGKYYIPIRPDTTPRHRANSSIASSANEVAGESFFQKSRPHDAEPSSSIQVIKNHPTAPRKYPEPSPGVQLHSTAQLQLPAQPSSGSRVISGPRSQQSARPNMFQTNEDSLDSGKIPSELRQSIIKFESSLVDTKALLSFCENALRKIQDGERKMIERFKSKLEALESTLSARDQEIKNLKQQLEDIQLLVKILEKRKSHN